jgi:vacuolar-type H+-ATPase subunit D/Vma8
MTRSEELAAEVTRLRAELLHREQTQRMMTDYFDILKHGQDKLMINFTEVEAQMIARDKALEAKVQAIADAQAAHVAAVNKAIEDIVPTVTAGHGAVMEKIAALTAESAKAIDAIDAPAKIAAMTPEVTAAITAAATKIVTAISPSPAPPAAAT